jgi:signal transduction histidine kinase
MKALDSVSGLPTESGMDSAVPSGFGSPRPAWQRSRWLTALAVALIFWVGGLATWAAWRLVQDGQVRDTQAVVNDQARAKSNEVQSVMALVQEALYGVGAHVANISTNVNSNVNANTNTNTNTNINDAAAFDAAFDGVAHSALARHESIVAIAWVEGFKPGANDKPGSFRGQALTQRNWLGNFIPAQAKPRHMPVARLALGKAVGDQAAAFKAFVGFDFSSDERWQDSLERARKTQNMQISYTGLGSTDSLLFLPVRRKGEAADEVSGYVVAAVALPALMSRALGTDAGALINRVFDASDPSGLKLIFPVANADVAAATAATAAAPERITPAERALGRQLTQRQTLQVLGSPWWVETEPRVSLLRQRGGAMPWLVLGLGSLATLLFAAYVAALRNRNAKVEKVVNQRTRQLNRAYSELRDTEMVAMQSEKMSSLGQMVAGVAHEINTPLGFVSSNLQMLQDVVGQTLPALQAQIDLMATLPDWRSLNSEQKRAWYRRALGQKDVLGRLQAQHVLDDGEPLVQESLVGLERISEIVTTLKDFSRVDRAQVDAVDLHHCINSTLVIAHNVVKHKAEVIKQYGVLPPVKCSPSQINQVLLNLITNAAQAIEEQGHIWISTRTDGDAVCIDIHDDGPGIPLTVQARLFEPFFTTKAAGQGTGLGLSICKKIMQGHGGTVGFVSELGKGCTFTLRLPAPGAKAAAAATQASAQALAKASAQASAKASTQQEGV